MREPVETVARGLLKIYVPPALKTLDRNLGMQRDRGENLHRVDSQPGLDESVNRTEGCGSGHDRSTALAKCAIRIDESNDFDVGIAHVTENIDVEDPTETDNAHTNRRD
jgi:hypothetical protein